MYAEDRLRRTRDVAAPPNRPTAVPTPSSTAPSRRKTPINARRDAPSAVRIATSFWRCCTPYAVTPYIPSIASNAAFAAKPARIHVRKTGPRKRLIVVGDEVRRIDRRVPVDVRRRALDVIEQHRSGRLLRT
jgi:hypothetical protein